MPPCTKEVYKRSHLGISGLLQNLIAMRMQISYKRSKQDNYAVISAEIHEEMLNVHVNQEPFVFLIKEERIIQEDL